jgi:DNA-binding CsgD family transcriptional regulator
MQTGRDAHVRIRRLSPRERECLILAGQGKSDWVIGQILGISARNAHNTLERAKKRLGVAGRIQAVVVALRERQISFDDLAPLEGL